MFFGSPDFKHVLSCQDFTNICAHVKFMPQDTFVDKLFLSKNPLYHFQQSMQHFQITVQINNVLQMPHNVRKNGSTCQFSLLFLILPFIMFLHYTAGLLIRIKFSQLVTRNLIEELWPLQFLFMFLLNIVVWPQMKLKLKLIELLELMKILKRALMADLAYLCTKHKQKLLYCCLAKINSKPNDFV